MPLDIRRIAPALRARDEAGRATYVAHDASTLVGVLHFRDGEHISLFFVRPERQGQGVGRTLIERADRATPDHPLASINSSTNAVRSYERYGFAASGPEQVSDGIRYVPMRRSPA